MFAAAATPLAEGSKLCSFKPIMAWFAAMQ